MSEKLIRLENFHRLVTERHYRIRDLMERGGRSYTFWRELQLGEKAFGEKLARSIEADFNLPPGWLDRVEAPVPTEGPHAPPADAMRLAVELLHLIADTPEPARLAAIHAAAEAAAQVRTNFEAMRAASARRSADQAIDQAQVDADRQSFRPTAKRPWDKR